MLESLPLKQNDDHTKCWRGADEALGAIWCPYLQEVVWRTGADVAGTDVIGFCELCCIFGGYVQFFLFEHSPLEKLQEETNHVQQDACALVNQCCNKE